MRDDLELQACPRCGHEFVAWVVPADHVPGPRFASAYERAEAAGIDFVVVEWEQPAPGRVASSPPEYDCPACGERLYQAVESLN